MKMKRRTTFILALLLSILVITLLWQLNQNTSSIEPTVNGNIVQVRSFHLRSDSTHLKTSTKGSVFVKGEHGQFEQIQIVAEIEIDPLDWGGVAFYIPDHWQVSSITSSYQGNQLTLIPEDYISIWKTSGKDASWRTMVEVGRDRSYVPTGGGTGTVMINLIPEQISMSTSESIAIGIEVGSKEENGKRMMGTDSIEVPLSLKEGL
ncbi:hypothetical protein [Paenibacillus illinoisensis]|uniref:hypothetical protein n=1 Tax=Paenibacillus illinoisensis TaxID=59845 RepID=UPI003D9648CB